MSPLPKKKKSINQVNKFSNLAYPATKHFLLRVEYTEDKILPSVAN